MTSGEGDFVPQISGWLLERRAQISQRATEHGLPPSISISVPVADFTDDGGMLSTTETRLVSPFVNAASFVPPASYAAATEPMIDATGERLAKRLVQVYGESVKYLSDYGPGVLLQELEHPDLISVLAFPVQSPNDPSRGLLSWEPIFYALMLLRQCLLAYLAALPSLSVDDAGAAKRLAEEVVGFAASEETTSLARVPLAGLDIEGEHLAIDDCALRRLSREELGYLRWRRTSSIFRPSPVAANLPGSFSPEAFLQERVALEVRSRHPKALPFLGVAETCQKTLLALHLIGLEFAGAGFGAMLREPRWVWPSGQSVHPLLTPKRPPPALTVVSDEDLQSARTLAALIPDGAVSNPTSPTDLAFRRLGLAMSRQEPAEALVDYTIALEALFLGGAGTGEIRHRFALNGAVYLGKTRAERHQLHEDLLKIYDARSILVHGVDPSERRAKKVLPDIAEIRDQATEIVRAVLQKALRTGWPTQNTFMDALLDDAPPSTINASDTTVS